MARGLPVLVVGCCLGVALGTTGAAALDVNTSDLVNTKVLRVCSDPANMPFSNAKKEGFENKIADIVADELKLPIEYTWFPQVQGFVRMTLSAKKCDIIMGFAQGDELVLNTNHYYKSTYAILYKPGKGLDGVDTIEDPRLKDKSVGIIAGTPPADNMAKAGLMGKARPYGLTVDRRYDAPGQQMADAIRAGEIDAGIMWGPMAAYFAGNGGEKLAVTPLMKEAAGPRMSYRITFGVRTTDDAWKRRLNQVILKRQKDIDSVLLQYGVPIIDEQDHLITAPRG